MTPDKMPYPEALPLAKRALAHVSAGTTDQAPAIMEVALENYLDRDRYHRERRRVFLQSPIAAILSLELPSPGTFVARSIMGYPVLLTRADDGAVRAFLNVCRHRGAPVCPEGSGHKARFSCPYHGWTYDAVGRLTHVFKAETVGDFDRSTRHLTALWCEEAAGFVWLCLTPGLVFDARGWLGDLLPRLQALQLDNWVLFEQRDLPGPGWKVTMDGYLEVYHHDLVHRSTVGHHTIGNVLVHDTYGPHQRLTFARRHLSGMAMEDLSADNAESMIRLVHSVFPNLSISGILGGHCLVSQIFPGEEPDQSVTRQSVLCARGERTPDWEDAARAFSAMALTAVQDEDYKINTAVQQGLTSGANHTFLLGRNEPGVQHYHQSVADLMATPVDAQSVDSRSMDAELMQ